MPKYEVTESQTYAEAQAQAQERLEDGCAMRTGEIDCEGHEDGTIEVRFADAETALAMAAALGRAICSRPEDRNCICQLMNALTEPVFGNDPQKKMEFAIAECEDPLALLGSLFGKIEQG